MQNNIIKQLVNKVHVTQSGKPRSIGYDNKTRLFWTRTEGGVLIRAKSEMALYEKLYQHYYGKQDFTIRRIFELAIYKKESEEGTKSATIRKYRIDYNRYINDTFSETSIQAVTESDLKQYTVALLKRDAMSKKSFLAYKTILNLIFGFAMSNEIIRENPIVSIQNKIYLKQCAVKDESENRILSQEEIELFKAEVDKRISTKDYYIYGHALKFAICTGVRVGELCAIKWSDINFADAVIHIHSQQLWEYQNGKKSAP